MSIANELSSDVALAVLTSEAEAPRMSASEKIDMVAQVHSTLRHLTAKARRLPRHKRKRAEPPAEGNSAAAGQ